ncbi:hypothetical protein INR79_25825 [Vibrio sp. SCSIO 43132]|uniref:hypothetical protein n=1 Tax=Vibrio sp. SCSIO 43132 TaxID=2779363 RepID=UPI001CA94DAC|nr:hypothetical protein [Vibrio sp. SCSIO 43132]UAB72678.1 hypothetical protein INR79_25825 [Vibrio sp. SCSIO 43132]
MASSGFNLRAVMTKDRQKVMLNNLEEHLDSQLENLRGLFEKHGYQGEHELEASLEITDTQYIAIFPKYGITTTLMSKA